MDPFHVARLAGDALDRRRRRVQQDLHGHRGRTGHRSTALVGPCTPAPTCSPTDNARRWQVALLDEVRTNCGLSADQPLSGAVAREGAQPLTCANAEYRRRTPRYAG